ncbi:MAG: hypothetical protein Tsb0019_27160 [Roseibium sp.]
MDLDVLYLADLRFPGGTATSLKYDLRACRKAGLKAGIVPLSSPVFSRNQIPNAALLDEVEASGALIVPHGECPSSKVALLYHPSLLDRRVECRTRFETDAFYLVVHQPTRDRTGRAYFETENWPNLASAWFGSELMLLPVSDIVRQDLTENGWAQRLHASNWTNLIDLDDFPTKVVRTPGKRTIVGRHSRPSHDKWPSPSIALQCYPPLPDIDYRMLGVPDDYLDLFDTLPLNWQAYPFTSRPVSGFLRGLDIYSYFHSETWIEAFGYNVLEALATGLPCIVPHYMKSEFGDACIYADPGQAPKIYERLRDDETMWQEASSRARAFAESSHSLDQYTTKFQRVRGQTAGGQRRGVHHRRRETAAPVVLSVTSNGIGLGHLSRQLAIAKALGPNVNVVFFSLSEAIEVARSMGYLAEFRPFHRRLELDVDDWNNFFFQELREALGHYRPAAVLFDGNVPYKGFTQATEAYGKAYCAWIRRGMWRSQQPENIAREVFFDAVLEPGELCQAADPGYSRINPDGVSSVNPVIATQPRNLFERRTARKALQLPENATLCLVQLGSEANFDMTLPRELLFDFLDRRPDVIAVDVRSPLNIPPPPDIHDRLISRRIYPLGPHLKAFDFAFCAAGYNTFHENIAASVPTLFVPNSGPEMDMQEARADFGARAGWNLTCTADDPYAIDLGLTSISDPDIRGSLSRACSDLSGYWNGSWQIARHLQLLAQLPRNPIEEH